MLRKRKILGMTNLKQIAERTVLEATVKRTASAFMWRPPSPSSLTHNILKQSRDAPGCKIPTSDTGGEKACSSESCVRQDPMRNLVPSRPCLRPPVAPNPCNIQTCVSTSANASYSSLAGV